MANDTYFAAKASEDTAGILMTKSHEWFLSLDASGYLAKLRTMWAAYHGSYYTDTGSSHAVTFSGEQGELAEVAVNHLRNFGEHIVNMITSVRPTMQARAINTDYKSLVQTKLANGLLDYYMRDHRLESYLTTAVKYAIVMGTGYVKLEWNATRGEVYEFDENLGVEIREGDIEFSNLSPFDVMFDTNREDQHHDWVLCRSWKNRYDLAAKFPELEDNILRLPTKDKVTRFGSFTPNYDDTDLIPVYEFYHKRTESMSNGRYLLFLDKDCVLLDSPMPYRDLPVYQIAPSYFLGTPYGYTPLFDLLGLQDSVNSLYSTVLTNQTAFGVQNILVPKEADVSISSLSGGLNIIEAAAGADQIRPLNLTQTPAEIFQFIGMLEKIMETISGVNSVSRGNPDPNLRSGNALALVQSMTLQFFSGLQREYVALIEDLGTGIINILKDHAMVPRVATIIGKKNRAYIKEFVGEDLSAVNRVVVDIGNPLSRTTAGRVEMAGQLLQMGAIKSPEQYFAVIETGQLDLMTEDTQSQLYLIKAENERMVTGEPVQAIYVYEHALHIKEHSAVLADPELRFNPELVTKVMTHIQEHIQLLQTTDPSLLQILQQQPITPPNVSIQGQISETMGGMPVATQLQQQGNVPVNMPTIPQVNASSLANPELQQRSMGNVKNA